MCSLRVGSFGRCSSLECTSWPAKADVSEKRLVALATGKLAMYFVLLKAGISALVVGQMGGDLEVKRSFVAS